MNSIIHTSMKTQSGIHFLNILLSGSYCNISTPRSVPINPPITEITNNIMLNFLFSIVINSVLDLKKTNPSPIKFKGREKTRTFR